MTINLKSETLHELEEIASQYGLEADDLLNKALKNYRRQLEEAKIETEKQQFLSQYAQLKQIYLGQFIAMHQGQVVDHDSNFEILHRRIRQKYGREAILMRRVEEEPDRPLMWRSPRGH
ncbi:MAG: hypothetical protein HYR94_14870 [Chloroflexi bacterium]|nr:hypothetical protein [Chloroflexota bacterium]